MNNDPEQNIIKSFTQCPNIIFHGLPDVAIQDKWALLSFISICWSRSKGNITIKELEGPYKLSLREIEAITGIPRSTLHKTAGKNPRDGVLDRLQSLGYITLLEGRPINETTGKEGRPQTYLYIHLEKLWCDNLAFSESWRMPPSKLVDTDTFTTMADSTVHDVTNSVRSMVHPVTSSVHYADSYVNHVTDTVHLADGNGRVVNHTADGNSHRVNHTADSTGHRVNHTVHLADGTGHVANHIVHYAYSNGHIVSPTADSTGHRVNHTVHLADGTGHVADHIVHYAYSNGHIASPTADSTGHRVNYTVHHTDSNGHVVNHTVHDGSTKSALIHNYTDNTIKDKSNTDKTVKDESNTSHSDQQQIYLSFPQKSSAKGEYNASPVVCGYASSDVCIHETPDVCVYTSPDICGHASPGVCGHEAPSVCGHEAPSVCGVAENDRKGRDGASPSSTHLGDVSTPAPVEDACSSKQLDSKERQRENRPRRVSTSRDIVLTRPGEHILDLYDGFKRRKAIRNEATLLAANRLGEVVGSDEDFLAVLNAIANDQFLKHKQVRTDLDFVYRKYDGFLDIVERARGRQPPGESGGKTDYNAVMGMTDEERAAYKREQQEKLKQALPPGIDRQTLMNMKPEDRIPVLRKIREQQQVTGM